MTIYKKNLFIFSLIALMTAPFSGLMAFCGCCGGGDEDEQKVPLTRKQTSVNAIYNGPAVVTAVPVVQHSPVSQLEESERGRADLTTLNASMASQVGSIQEDNDHLLEHLTGLVPSHPGTSILHQTNTKLILEFTSGDTAPMQIALMFVAPQQPGNYHNDCFTKGTLVNKSDFPLVASLLVHNVRETLVQHHKAFSRRLNGSLQKIFDATEVIKCRVSTDEKFREFTFDLKDQPCTSSPMLYGFSAQKGNSSLSKRLDDYK